VKREILVCKFEPGDRGLVCKQPVNRMSPFGRVYLDKDCAQPDVGAGQTWLCRLLHTTPLKVRFVFALKSTVELLGEFIPTLTAVPWRRSQHATDGIRSEAAFVAGYGQVSASWHENTGRFKLKFVALKFTMDGQAIDLTVEESEAPKYISMVERRVRECTTPGDAGRPVPSLLLDPRRSIVGR
jgi:hypothetical protein